MVESSLPNSNKIKVLFKVYKPDGEHIYEVIGRVAQTIVWLVARGDAGVTALEISTWALRLGAYVHILRHTFDVNIATHNEPHEGGHHARYALIDAVEILALEPLD